MHLASQLSWLPACLMLTWLLACLLCLQIMALSYAVIAPLVLPAALGFFFTAWLAWRYCCLYFYERSYESGGRLFETLFTLVVWTLVVFSLFTSLVSFSLAAIA